MLTSTLSRVIDAISNDSSFMDRDIRSIEELHNDCAYILLDDEEYCVTVANEPPIIVSILPWERSE